MLDLEPSSAAYDLSDVDLVRFCSEISPKDCLYELSVNEARFGLSRVLRVLSSFDPKTVEVLEVGAGILYPTGLSGEQAAARYGR